MGCFWGLKSLFFSNRVRNINCNNIGYSNLTLKRLKALLFMKRNMILNETEEK